MFAFRTRARLLIYDQIKKFSSNDLSPPPSRARCSDECRPVVERRAYYVTIYIHNSHGERDNLLFATEISAGVLGRSRVRN